MLLRHLERDSVAKSVVVSDRNCSESRRPSVQEISEIPYTLFLQSPCAYACGDRESVSTRCFATVSFHSPPMPPPMINTFICM